ncbi:MAG TPA: T9SS type A sorting domain-containing protein, partial [bacterium]
GWVLGEYGKIIYTQNAGQTWLEQPRLAEGLAAMTFVDPVHGWVVGYDGKILHTAQAGLAKQTASRMSSQIKPDLATNYQLYQNYPNPFNPITTIRYNLPQNDKVTLKIYNLLGQEVKTFFNLEHQLAGQHQVIWDGCDINGYPSTSGVYFAVLSGSNWKRTMKLVLIK